MRDRVKSFVRSEVARRVCDHAAWTLEIATGIALVNHYWGTASKFGGAAIVFAVFGT